MNAPKYDMNEVLKSFEPISKMMKTHFPHLYREDGQYNEDRDEREDNPQPDVEAEVLDDPAISLKVTGNVVVDKVIETGALEHIAEPQGIKLAINKIPVELSEVQQRLIIMALGDIAEDRLIDEVRSTF